MNLEQMIIQAQDLRDREDKDGYWAHDVCGVSTKIHEEVLESGTSTDYVNKEVLPVLSDLAKAIQKVDPKGVFSRYIGHFCDNVHWRISELEKYVSKKEEKKDSTVLSTTTP